MGMRTGILVFIAVFQSILLAAHLFVYRTWLHFGIRRELRALADRTLAVLVLAGAF
jgi:hypothetical protein